YLGIVDAIPLDLIDLIPIFQGVILSEGMSGDAVALLQEYLSFISQTYPDIPAVEPTGYFGPQTKASVIAFQKHFGIPPRGVVASITWNKIALVYSDLKYGMDRRVQQFPGFIIS
ncbi:MAG: peptidoglycan-binding protein, partial [Clostridiales bacterium]|nr:peptidoglycan-binding protein [Clostridiales bacterium]